MNPINQHDASPVKRKARKISLSDSPVGSGNAIHYKSTTRGGGGTKVQQNTTSFHDLLPQQQSDIKDAFHFLAISDPTKISQSDLQTVFKDVLNEQLSLSECQAIFDEVDEDRSGQIDLEEFIHLMMGGMGEERTNTED
eukprot:CAMPEP_0117448354 /NCGR_PEP_ID=MMETSP0759-20121206/7355_1 /TAXON_ID=63605 /ORGANISM="Percolomonas cosmopolitus, Strain WS" /LENGTH=138 /DNA_ID=CAMNT_0005240733 /DNA_START=215 /DNA_END=631 /DNA_ORIENTATION=+